MQECERARACRSSPFKFSVALASFIWRQTVAKVLDRDKKQVTIAKRREPKTYQGRTKSARIFSNFGVYLTTSSSAPAVPPQTDVRRARQRSAETENAAGRAPNRCENSCRCSSTAIIASPMTLAAVWGECADGICIADARPRGRRRARVASRPSPSVARLDAAPTRALCAQGAGRRSKMEADVRFVNNWAAHKDAANFSSILSQAVSRARKIHLHRLNESVSVGQVLWETFYGTKISHLRVVC